MKILRVIRTAYNGNLNACEIMTEDKKGTGKFVYITTELPIPPLTEFTIEVPED